MKYIVKSFVVTFLLLISTHTFAETKIVVVDLKYVLNNSKAGKGAQDFLLKSFKDNQNQFKDKEKALKEEENDLLKKRNILSKEDYTKKANELRKQVIDYQSNRQSSLDKIAQQRSESKNKLMKEISPILDAYMKENSISLVFDKKDMLGGKPELDVTDIIIERLNKKLPSLNLK
jgi:outer membrane protein